MRIKEKFNNKLLVEGNDDQHVIWALCQKFNIPETFDVVDSEGINNLLEQISVRLKQSGIQRVGIIIDADENIKKRWDNLHALLSNLGVELPLEIPVTGLIVYLDNVKIGVWIMPNNSINGMLEDFISFLIPKDDELIIIATETLKDIENKGLSKYSLIHKSKAIVHTWLAWQEDPGTPMGLAITKKYLTCDQEHCLKLLDWIKNVFE